MTDRKTLYITGAGVSAESGIPTFRGVDGYWTIGSQNYTPQQMATRQMYQTNPLEFLKWYYHRFATYRHHGPNNVHYWLANKNLITQNIDGLDAKAGNKRYISIHGRLDKITLYLPQEEHMELMDAPWEHIDESALETSLLDIFKIRKNRPPQVGHSYKPFVLLFDEYYTNLYRISDAERRMHSCTRIIFIGTSFSVNITQIALSIAAKRRIPIEVVDPEPQILPYSKTAYHRMTANEYIDKQPQ